MKVYLVITIDVEPDCTPTWKYSSPLTFHGVTEGIQKRLQPLFNKYNIVPTYLINNVVLEDGQSTDTFLKLEGRFELGTHLHAEFIAPEKQFTDYAGKKGEANQCFLDAAVEFEKLKNITALFKDNFSHAPKSFRAGRFSAGENTIQSLRKLGYKVDTSVTPHVIWSDKTREQPVDYSSAYDQPYFIKNGSYLESDHNGDLLEVPVSIMRSSFFFRKKLVWLRPHLSSARDFIRIANHFSARYADSESVVLNMMFHNVEVMPGLSPYSQTEKDCQEYLGSMESFFAFCKKNEIQSVALSDLYEIWKR